MPASDLPDGALQLAVEALVIEEAASCAVPSEACCADSSMASCLRRRVIRHDGRARPSARRGRPPRISRDQVLAARHCALVDGDGLERLTMRRLGTELGVDPMAIYGHMPDKAALFDGLIEIRLRRDRAARADWRIGSRDFGAVARAARSTLARTHPNVVALLGTRPPVTERGVRTRSRRSPRSCSTPAFPKSNPPTVSTASVGSSSDTCSPRPADRRAAMSAWQRPSTAKRRQTFPTRATQHWPAFSAPASATIPNASSRWHSTAWCLHLANAVRAGRRPAHIGNASPGRSGDLACHSAFKPRTTAVGP